ncbi:hypothetical protein [Streptomyces chartreusis]|uniref:hypothetical protein n=1 Tax=Streptomyces chartreusis TaxID=1969 RepID=UPI0033E8D22A
MTDNCPRCCTSTSPQDPADDPQRYICRACGHSWTTNHHATAYEPPADTYAIYDDPDAWEAEDPTEPWWTDWNNQDQDHGGPYPDDPDSDLIARILARENHTTYTVERLNTPTAE